MTPEEKTTLEVFTLRQANLTLIERVFGEDIFKKIAQQGLNLQERNYFLYLAEQEEGDLLGASRETRSAAAQMKISRLLKNVQAVKVLLTRKPVKT